MTVTQEINGGVIKLTTSIDEVTESRNEILGILRYDTVRTCVHRGQVLRVPETLENRFVFDMSSGFRPIIIVFGTPQDEVSQIVESIVFPKEKPGIAKASIDADDIRRFVETKASSIKVCTWRDLNIPNLSKSTLSGASVERARTDFQRYNTRGKMNYVMMELTKNGWVVAISEEARVIVYNKATGDEIVSFIQAEIRELLH